MGRPAHALARLPAGRPQPAQDPHRPGHRRHPVITRPAHLASPDHRSSGTPDQPTMPRTARQARRNRETRARRPPTRNVRPKRKDKCRSKVKTTGAGERIRTTDLPFTGSTPQLGDETRPGIRPGFRRRLALNERGFDHVAGYEQLVANLPHSPPRGDVSPATPSDRNGIESRRTGVGPGADGPLPL